MSIPEWTINVEGLDSKAFQEFWRKNYLPNAFDSHRCACAKHWVGWGTLTAEGVEHGRESCAAITEPALAPQLIGTMHYPVSPEPTIGTITASHITPGMITTEQYPRFIDAGKKCDCGKFRLGGDYLAWDGKFTHATDRCGIPEKTSAADPFDALRHGLQRCEFLLPKGVSARLSEMGPGIERLDLKDPRQVDMTTWACDWDLLPDAD